MQTFWFLFNGEQLFLIRKGRNYELPEGTEPPAPVEGLIHEIARTEECAYLAAAIEQADLIPALPATENTANGPVWMGLREAYDLLPVSVYRMAGKGKQLIFWDKNSRFCPACGEKTILSTAISKKCPGCGKEIFPHVSPAILVMIHRGEEILLVHARNFKGPFHSLIAGFVETGESLEECVAREVREETTLEITHIRYFGSQEWPYPSGLMIGFEADYVSGDIRFADGELSEGGFCTRENLPVLPQKLSLARKMIDSWLQSAPVRTE